jgi:muramoyltetrapeptide carboxypeptidase
MKQYEVAPLGVGGSKGIIGITCPSGYVAPERVTYAIEVLKKWGYEVKLGNTIGTGEHYFSGTDEERLTDLQSMLDDPSLSAILMGRGGYGLSRIIDQVDFTKFRKHPKWICGFSDITVLHNHIQAQFGIPTLHSPMCGAFKPETENEDYILCFKKALAGEALSYTIPPNNYNKYGEATGILTGGNLCLLAHLTGSPSEVNTEGKILFIEDISEYLYNIDRLLMNLQRAGKLEKLAGLICGSFTELQDTERPFGQTLEEIVLDKVEYYDYPVLFNFPTGHQDINYTLTLGAKHKLLVDQTGGKLELIK